MTIPKKKTLRLTHYGRKSGKPFQVTIWYVVLNGELWIGSLDETRNWVRNLRATGRAAIDFGDGPKDVRAQIMDHPRDLDRYAGAVLEKYPILARVIALFVRNKSRAVFKLRAA